jgi:hypothetical protein
MKGTGDGLERVQLEGSRERGVCSGFAAGPLEAQREMEVLPLLYDFQACVLLVALRRIRTDVAGGFGTDTFDVAVDSLRPRQGSRRP